jgi:phage terminase large subunit GpA-like protein
VTPRDRFPGLARGDLAVAAGLAAGFRPPPVVTVSEWADQNRVVAAESGSPYPGAWSTDRVPYAREIMDCLSFSHPSREVVFAKSAQVAGTELGLNLIGYVIDVSPAPVVAVLPTLDEAKKWVKLKLAPTLSASPALRHKVAEQKSRDETGSTTSFKRFRGGFLQVTGANSSRGLQMISGRVLIGDEVSEWPDDVDGRGDPVTLAEKRLTAWDERDPKRFYLSTPGIEGTCRITEKERRSDRRRYYVPCPHCGHYQALAFKRLRWRSDTAPHGAYMVCAAHGCVIEHVDKRRMLTEGAWIKTYEGADGTRPPEQIAPEDLPAWRNRPSEGRQPGFHLWQAYSPFVAWDSTVAEWLGAQGDPFEEKVFTQQVLGLPYEERGEAPDYQRLVERREPYQLGTIPPGGLVLTGACDVQADRLEFAVYAWGANLTGWLVDRGVLAGDPAQAEVWQRLDEVVHRTYTDANGRAWSIEAFGVDAGYLSSMVYMFARGRERVLALDGRPGALMPAIGTPRRVDISWQGKQIKRGVMLWPVGTHPLKSAVYSALRKTIEGPDSDGVWPAGCLRYPEAVDREWFEQLTAEYMAETEEKGRIKHEWKKMRGRANEALDLTVYARALASHLGLDRLSSDDWIALAHQRGHDLSRDQASLADLWAPAPRQDIAAARAPAPAAAEQPAEGPRARPRGGAPRGSGFLNSGRSKGWLS